MHRRKVVVCPPLADLVLRSGQPAHGFRNPCGDVERGSLPKRMKRIDEENQAYLDAITQQYTYGNYLDEVWTLDNRRTSGGASISVSRLNDGTGAQRLFFHQNTLYSPHALTDAPNATNTDLSS